MPVRSLGGGLFPPEDGEQRVSHLPVGLYVSVGVQGSCSGPDPDGNSSCWVPAPSARASVVTGGVSRGVIERASVTLVTEVAAMAGNLIVVGWGL